MLPDPPPRSIADERSELLRRAREGSTEAWDSIVGRYGDLVLTVARDVGLSEADCEEVFQNTWIAFLGQIDLLREPSALGRWLVITAQRHAWRAWRRSAGSSRDIARDLPPSMDWALDEGPSPEDTAQSLERRTLVREALEELSTRCRELLKRLYLRADGRTYHEVAEELGLPRGSIGPTRMRCLASLAAVLERRGMF